LNISVKRLRIVFSYTLFGEVLDNSSESEFRG